MRTAKEQRCETCDPVGTREIAARLDTQHNTVAGWRKRGILPEPRWFISGTPAWDWPDIEEWAKTKRGAGRPPKGAAG